MTDGDDGPDEAGREADTEGVPGGEREGTTPVCPACESEHVEAIDPAASPLEYRCLDCGAEFDESGGRIAVE